MSYLVSFTDKNNDEFMGTTEHFSTDGRYSLDTVLEIARRAAAGSLMHDNIVGFNLRKDRFKNPVIRSFTL